MNRCTVKRVTQWLSRGAVTAAASLVLLGEGTAHARTDLCYQGGALLPNFQLNGSAQLNGTDLLVTNNSANQSASIMYIPTFAATSDIHIQMQPKISQAVGGGADGMAFVMHTDSRGATALGELGGGISYGGVDKITPSVVVELDTFQNGFDPNNNHIAIMLNGNETSHLATYTPPFDMRAVSSFYVWIDYTAATTTLAVYVSQTSTKPATSQLSYTINVAQHFGNTPFRMGFTGSTGGVQEQHEIVSFIASDSALTSAVCCNTNADCAGSPLGTQCDQVKHVCGQCSLGATASCSNGKQSCDIGPPSNTCTAPCSGDYGSGGAAACSTTSAAVCLTSGPNKGSCISCNGNNGSGATRPCPAGAPSCSLATGWCGFPCTSDGQCSGSTPVCELSSGSCVQCLAGKTSACVGATPTCNLASSTCTGCASDSDCGGSTPACNLTTHLCVQCTGANGSACVGATPTCNTTTNVCTGCAKDGDCEGPTPACNTATHLCVECTASNLTKCAGTTPQCSIEKNLCVGCSNDSQCSGETPYCNTEFGTCGACVVQGEPNHCPAETPQCETINLYNVCTAPGSAQQGCACNVPGAAPSADFAAVAMAIFLAVRRRRGASVSRK